MSVKRTRFSGVSRQLAALVALLLVGLLLVACGEATSTTVAPTKIVATTAPTNTTAPTVTPTSAPARDFSEIDTYIKQMMADYSVPGVGIGLVQDGKIIYTKGYGVRDTKTNAPVTENTQFEIGSITKSFTSLGALQLVEQGKLDLDTPIIKYLPDFKLSDPAATQKVTMRHVLSHTSGLPPANADVFQGKPRQQILTDIASINLTAQPGQTWQYSNQNFVIAGAVIEKVSGQSWEDYIRQHILNPLGMKTANFDVATMQKTPDFASPHQLDVLKGMQPAPFTELGGYGPAGSINASVQEMAQYVRFQVGDGSFDGGQPVISNNLFNLMHTQQFAMPQSSDLFTNQGYGLGWTTGEYRGYKLVSHDGSTNTFFANAFLAPAAKSGVIVLTNGPYHPSVITFSYATSLRLTEWVLGLKSEQDLAAHYAKSFGFNLAQFKANLETARNYKADPASLTALEGEYNGGLGKVIVKAQDGKLSVEVVSGPAKGTVNLVPFKPNGFLGNTLTISGQVFEFKTDENGTITIMQEGTSIAQKLGKNVKLNEYKDPQGRFSAVLPTGLVVQQKGDLAIIPSADPAGTFLLAAQDSGSDDLPTNVKKALTKLDATFNLSPVATQAIPISGQTWTQFLYQLPGDQLLAVVAIQQKSTTYFVIAQAKSADVPALTPTFNSLLTGFKIG